MRLIPSFLAAAAAMAALCAAPAHAQSYGVTAGSSALAGPWAGSASCYVNSTFGPNNVTCSAPHDPSVPGSASASANVNTPANPGSATSATTSVHEDGASVRYYGDPGGFGTASANVTADLSSASLHMSSTVSDTNIGSASSTGSSAGLFDTLHFAVAGADASTMTTIGLSLTVDGTMVTGNSQGYGEFYGGLTFAGGSYAQFFLGNYGSSHGTSSTGNQTVGTFSSYVGGWTSNADYTVNTYTGTYTLIGASATIPIGLSANLNCYGGFGDGASCDYGNTAKLSLQLPSDVSYTSDSGVFLNDGTTGGAPITAAVPEPQTWALMAGGLALIGSTLRRRRRAEAPQA